MQGARDPTAALTRNEMTNEEKRLTTNEKQRALNPKTTRPKPGPARSSPTQDQESGLGPANVAPNGVSR